MINELNTLFFEFNKIAKENAILSGIVGLWGLGILTYVLKDIPKNVGSFFVKHFTIQLDLQCKNSEFYDFIDWYENQKFRKYSRTYLITKKTNPLLQKTHSDLGAGFGEHFFFFEGRPFFFKRSKEQLGSHNDIREQIALKTIGRSLDIFKRLLKEITPENNSSQITEIYKFNESYWEYSHDQEVRNLDSVIMNEGNRLKTFQHLDNFKNSQDWYLKHGIPYRTGICLYGPPGTGKTSLVRAICGREKRNLFILNLNGLSDSSLSEALDTVEKDSIILIEDIDSYSFALSRDFTKPVHELLTTKVTLSGLLNAIDGVSSSAGRILIITTNHPYVLDEALLRPGRIDLKLELTYMDEDMIRYAFSRFFPEYKLVDISFRNDITPAKFQNLASRYRHSPEIVLKLINYTEGEVDSTFEDVATYSHDKRI